MNKYDEIVEFPHIGQVPCSNKTQYSSLFDYRTLNVLCLYPVYTVQPVVEPVLQPVVSCRRGFTYVSK